MLTLREVNGAATDASAVEREIPEHTRIIDYLGFMPTNVVFYCPGPVSKIYGRLGECKCGSYNGQSVHDLPP